jgi:hypothetical protein
LKGGVLRKLLLFFLTLAAALAAGAQTPTPPGFTEVEVIGWDFSGFDEKIREAVSKANAPGAGADERGAAAAALSERADFFWRAGNPRFYKYALGDYRHVLRFRPEDAEAREHADTIVGIYQQMGRPVPTNGEAKPGEGFLVELFKTKPKRLEFEPGKPYTEGGGEVSDRVAFVYQFDARAGQALNINVRSTGKSAAVFDLLLSEAAEPRQLLRGEHSKRYLLPSQGDYLIRVYTKGGSTSYDLKAELK